MAQLPSITGIESDKEIHAKDSVLSWLPLPTGEFDGIWRGAFS
jgi:hypothetical protein